MNTPLHQELARAGFPGLAQIVSDLRDGQLDLQASMEELRVENGQQNASISRLLSGFPNGDVETHRRYHQSEIEWRELRNKIVRDCLMNAAKTTSLAALGWLAYAIWQAFVVTVKR